MYCEQCNIDDITTVSHTAVVCYAETSKAEKIHKTDLTQQNISSSHVNCVVTRGHFTKTNISPGATGGQGQGQLPPLAPPMLQG